MNDSEESLINFEFEPQVCQDCMAQNELDKMLFENKKILIRIQDEEENNCTSKLENLKNEEMEDSDVIHIVRCLFIFFPKDLTYFTELKKSKI